MTKIKLFVWLISSWVINDYEIAWIKMAFWIASLAGNINKLFILFSFHFSFAFPNQQVCCCQFSLIKLLAQHSLWKFHKMKNYTILVDTNLFIYFFTISTVFTTAHLLPRSFCLATTDIMAPTFLFIRVVLIWGRDRATICRTITTTSYDYMLTDMRV